MKSEHECKILTFINEDEGKYTWQELNCLYRPFAIVLKSFDKDYFDIFLMLLSNVHAYYKDDTYEYAPFRLSHPMMDLFRNDYNDVFSVDVEGMFYDSEEDFHTKVKKSLDEDTAIIIPGDVFKLFYHSAYLVKHDTHYYIVKGYDETKGIYYLLDNCQINNGANTQYVDFQVRFDDLYDIIDSFMIEYENGVENKYFWTLSKRKDFKYDKVKCCRVFEKQLRNILEENALNHLTEVVILNDIKNGTFQRDIQEDLTVINFRNVYYDTLPKFLDINNFDKNIVSEIREYTVDLRMKWREIKKKLMYSFFKNKLNDDMIEKEIEALKEKEENLIHHLIQILHNPSCVESSSKGYFIKNSKNAEWSFTDNTLLVKHSRNVIYDLWVKSDNAFQFLLDCNKNAFQEIETEVICNIDMGLANHSGIEIVCEDNTKFLFGNIRNIQLGLYEITSDGDSKELYLHQYGVSNGCVLKVENKELGLRFLVRLKNENEWTLVGEKKILSKVVNAGLFAKTWEFVEGKVCFSNNIYNNVAIAVEV